MPLRSAPRHARRRPRRGTERPPGAAWLRPGVAARGEVAAPGRGRLRPRRGWRTRRGGCFSRRDEVSGRPCAPSNRGFGGVDRGLIGSPIGATHEIHELERRKGRPRQCRPSRPAAGRRGRQAADHGGGAHPTERDEVAALRAPRLAHDRRRLDRPRRVGERAARHHRDQPLLRAHDVQGHDDDRHQGTSRRTSGSSRSRRSCARGCAPRWRSCGSACAGARSTTCRSPRARPSATASSTSSSTPSSRSSARSSIKDQLDQIYTKNGGEFLNAFTSED